MLSLDEGRTSLTNKAAERALLGITLRRNRGYLLACSRTCIEGIINIGCNMPSHRKTTEVSYRFRDEMTHLARLFARGIDHASFLPTKREEKNGRVALRMAAIVNALDGMTRTAAARLAGMDRQTLRDWVVRYNADGIDGLYDQPKGTTRKNSARASRPFCWPKFFKILILYGTAHAPGRFLISAISPRRALASGSRHQVCGACFSSLASPTKRRDRFIQRPIPKPSPTFKKGLLDALNSAVDAHPDKTIRLYFQDEARVGQ